MWKEEYDLLLVQLNMIFRDTITIKYIKALSDDDLESCYAVVCDGVIVGNPDFGLEYNVRNIMDYLMKKVGKLDESI